MAAQVVRRQPFDCDGLAALAEAQKSAAECAGSGGAAAEEEAGLQAAGATFRRALTSNAAHAESLAGLGETLVDLGRLQMKQGRREEAAATLAASGEVYFRFLQVELRAPPPLPPVASLHRTGPGLTVGDAGPAGWPSRPASSDQGPRADNLPPPYRPSY